MAATFARILLVSRDIHKITQLNDALRGLGIYEVVITNNPTQAALLLKAESFDLILLDIEYAGDQMQRHLGQQETQIRVPILLVGNAADRPRVTAAIEDGAADFLLLPTNATLLKARMHPHIQKKFLEEQAVSALQDFNEIEKLADDLRLVILPLGIALSTEKDFQRLLERIVIEAMSICNADSGLLYLRTEDHCLHAAIVRTGSLDLAYGGTTGKPIPYDDLPLYTDLGEPNLDNVATYVALETQSINVANIYDDSGFDFSGTIREDQAHGYRSISCLTVPLMNEDVIGVLQLVNAQDPQTGEVMPFGVYQQLVAESLASQAAVALHNQILSKEQERLLRYKRELQIGREIQAGFFPAALPEMPGWELVARFKAAREVAGDFYDVFRMPYGKVAFVVADVCDKGIVAALFMALVRSLLRAFLQQHYYLRTSQMPIQEQVEKTLEDKRPFQPADTAALLDVLRMTNAYIGSNHGTTYMFATVFFGMLDPTTGELIYVNCGHNPPLLLRSAGSHERLMPTGPAIGVRPDAMFYVAKTRLAPGDMLFAYTDGIVEARDPDGYFFGENRLLSVLLEAGKTAVAAQDAIEAALREYTQSTQPSDDIAMLSLRRQN